MNIEARLVTKNDKGTAFLSTLGEKYGESIIYSIKHEIMFKL